MSVLPASGDVQVACASPAVEAFRRAAMHVRWLQVAVNVRITQEQMMDAFRLASVLEPLELELIGLWQAAVADAPLQAEHAYSSAFPSPAVARSRV